MVAEQDGILEAGHRDARLFGRWEWALAADQRPFIVQPPEIGTGGNGSDRMTTDASQVALHDGPEAMRIGRTEWSYHH